VVSASFTASADALHCLGDTVSLLSNGSGGSNHSWLSNGQPFAQGQSASIAFPAPGGYSLVLISTNLSCSDTAEMSFTASAPPAVQGSVVQETCPGSADGSVDLTVTGGIPPYNFGWSNGASSEDLMMTAGGTYTVSVLDSLGCSAVDSFTVATGAGPVANFSTTSPSQLCPGSSAAFNNNSTGGTTFSWLNNGQLFAQTQNAAFTFSDGGTITISLVASDGLCNDTAEMVFTVFEPPLISSMITAENCPDTKDGAINLDVTGGEPPFAYAWNTGASTQDLSGLGNGTYILTIVDSESCTTTDTFHVETAGGITADFGWIQAGSVFIVFEDLSDTTATTWLWDFGDGATSTQKDPSHTYPSDGSYLVCLIVGDAFGCADTLCELVTFSVGAIAPEQFLPVKLFPNPTGGELTLDLSAISGQPVQLMLTDALGRKRMSVSTIAEAQTKLNLEAMAEGMYWVRVKAKEAEYVGRVVKR
jgi:PKD repeat protein